MLLLTKTVLVGPAMLSLVVNEPILNAPSSIIQNQKVKLHCEYEKNKICLQLIDSEMKMVILPPISKGSIASSSSSSASAPSSEA